MYQVDQWLKRATELLESSQIPTARLDALILLEDVTGKDRAWLLAHPQTPLAKILGSDPRHNKMLEKQVARRAQHEPLAYIRGKSEFYGREFKVTPATLQPRPETESIIDSFKEHIKPHINNSKARPWNVVDVGTGSGAIAITIKLEMPELIVHATEIQADAIEIAQKNAKTLGADVAFYQGDLLEPLSSPEFSTLEPLIILANLPYVPDSHTINQAAMQEPMVAIFGGPDGLDLYRKMFSQIDKYGLQPAFILAESLPTQHQRLAEIADSYRFRLVETDDFIQIYQPLDLDMA